MLTNTTQPNRTLRGLLRVVAGLLLVLGVGTVSAQSMTVRDSSATWNLDQGQVLEMGETAILPYGTLLTGYTIEARAESTDSPFISKGTLRVTLTAYTPKKDSHGQKVGIWYVRGKWTLSDIDAPPVTNTRFTPGVIGGLLQVELPFNPAASQGDWSASLRLPQVTMEPVSAKDGRQPMRGNGTLILDDKLGGVMTLDLKLWPRI